MRSVRTFRASAVAAVIAWKLAALAVLPAALCCQAVMVAEDFAATSACCEGGEHGAMCPMKRGGGTNETDAARGQPRLIGCNSLDDALSGLLGLSGFTPDAFEWTAAPERVDRIAEFRCAAASLVGAPSPPPPRA